MNKVDLQIRGADAVNMFCRLNINTKKNIPIRSAEMGLLIFIVKNEKSVTSIMAAEFFKVSKPMIANMIKSLSKQGYIEKVKSEVDKRSFILKATFKAIELVNETYSEYFSLMQILKDGLGEEKYIKFISLMEEANIILEKGRK